MKRLAIVGLALVAAGCGGSAGKSVCNKAKECCARVSRCDDINKQGEGYADRCGINYDAYIDALGTYGNSVCGKIASAYDDYYSCLGGVQCADINDAADDRGHVSKCDEKAKDYCNARKASGDACGGNSGNISCDNTKAYIGF